MMKSRQNNERTDPKKGRTSAKSRTRSGKDLLAVYAHSAHLSRAAFRRGKRGPCTRTERKKSRRAEGYLQEG